MQRFPDRGVRLLHELEHADATAPAAVRDVHASVEHLDRHGFRERESGARPTWKALAEGARPESIGDAIDPGNWPHGWQYHATDVLEQHEHKSLLSTFKRASAASPHVARLRSCAGPWSSIWMTIAPTSDGLKMRNIDMLIALRFRLGLSVPREFALRCEGCRALLDAKGYHRTTCNRTARLHARHRELVHA